MAIAGIEPEYEMRSLIEHAPAYVPHDFYLYTEEQVYEIIKRAAEFWVDNYDHYNEQFVDVDYDLEVSDFIKNG